MSATCRSLIVVVACVAGASATSRADGGRLVGRVLDAQTGGPLHRVTVRAYAHGRSVASAAMSERDGGFVLADLPAGGYALCVPASDAHRPLCVPDVQVSAGATTTVDLKVRQSLFIDGDSWVQPYVSFAQSFRASGLGVTMARVKAFGPGRAVRVEVLDGDGPSHQAIGPARVTVPVGGEGEASVLWAGGEVPTTPGKSYTFRLSALSGQTWVPGVAGRGDAYAGGSAWFDGSPRPDTDLGLVLCEDNDSLRTNYAMIDGPRVYCVTAAGQTFTALSRSVTFASAMLAHTGGPPRYVRFSVHNGGPTGEQIGPSKAVAVNNDAAVAWGPDEVPVTPGRIYYLHIESFDGGSFFVGVQPDLYAAGQAVFDGTPTAERDLAAIVAGPLTDADFDRLNASPGRVDVVSLRNPSFEQGMAEWQRTEPIGDAVGCDGGVVPAWGGRMFGWTNQRKGENTRMIVFQQVTVQPGARYVFSGSVYTDHRGGRSSDVKTRLVVAPGGGVELRNYDKITSSQWYATEGQWRRGSVEFEATAEQITVGFELEQRWSLDSSSVYVDGAMLERIGTR